MLARFQALLQLAQTGATLVMMPVAGVLVGTIGPEGAGLVLGAVLLATIVPLLGVPQATITRELRAAPVAPLVTASQASASRSTAVRSSSSGRE
jgi:hypothetical protein